VKAIHLVDVPLGPVSQAARAMRAEGRGKNLQPADLARFALVLSRVEGSTLLDVGYGSGLFLDAATASGRFTELAGVEPRPAGAKAIEGWERWTADAACLPFEDRSWDTVTALEVLEHQPDGKVDIVLAELKRVARTRLILTVPLCEPWPPATKGHLQRFCPERLAVLFPRATLTRLEKGNGRYPWVMIEERRP
jgi:ubiquinone/menaquinone biosynthesis C-methylase UbiE